MRHQVEAGGRAGQEARARHAAPSQGSSGTWTPVATSQRLQSLLHVNSGPSVTQVPHLGQAREQSHAPLTLTLRRLETMGPPKLSHLQEWQGHRVPV